MTRDAMQRIAQRMWKRRLKRVVAAATAAAAASPSQLLCNCGHMAARTICPIRLGHVPTRQDQLYKSLGSTRVEAARRHAHVQTEKNYDLQDNPTLNPRVTASVYLSKSLAYKVNFWHSGISTQQKD